MTARPYWRILNLLSGALKTIKLSKYAQNYLDGSPWWNSDDSLMIGDAEYVYFQNVSTIMTPKGDPRAYVRGIR